MDGPSRPTDPVGDRPAGRPPRVVTARRLRRRAANVSGAVATVAVIAVLAAGLPVALELTTSARRAAERLPTGTSRVDGSSSAASPGAGGANARCSRVPDVDSTGRDDVTEDLQRFFDASPDGSAVCLVPSGRYRMEGSLHLAGRNSITVDGRGSTIFSTTRGTAPRILIDHGSSDIDIHDLAVTGFWPEAGTRDAAQPAYEGNHGIAIGGAEHVGIGPGVHITDVGGDGVYITSGTLGSTVQWADDIRVHDAAITRTGRMGVAITDGARNVAIDRVRFDDIALYVLDLEPNGHAFGGVPAGAEHVRLRDSRVGSYGVSPLLDPWFVAGTGRGPQTDVEISRNRLTGSVLRIGVWNVDGSGRRDFRVLDNRSDTAADGPVMQFDGVEGLRVQGNSQPLVGGPLAMIRNSTVDGPVN